MQELELTWERVASVWWFALWRGTTGGVLVGAIGGGIAALIAAYITGNSDPAMGYRAGQVGGFIAAIPWGFVVVRMTLKKKYRRFRIALIPRENSN